MRRQELDTFVYCILMIHSTMYVYCSDLQLCRSGSTFNTDVSLNMDTTLIAGSDGMCSCRITVGGLKSTPSIFVVSVEKIISSGCVNDNLEFVLVSNRTSDSLDGTYEFTCNNNRIDSTPAQELRYGTHYGEDVLWLLVTRKENSPIISGTLEIKSRLKDNQIGFPFSMECYEPNTNVSTEFTRPTTSPSSSTTKSTTHATTINLLTDLHICRSGMVTKTEINVNMDTSRILGLERTCSCRITLSPSFLWVSVGDINSPKCTDGDPLFKLQTVDKTNSCTCQDGGINASCTQELSRQKYKDNDIMWLIVTQNSPNLSGRMKITSKDASGFPGFPYTVECYEPNTNTSTTSLAPITSTMTVNPAEGSVSSLSPPTSSVTTQTSTPTSFSGSDSSPSTKVSSTTTTLPLPESTEQSQTTTKKSLTGPKVALSSSSISSTLTSPPSQPPPPSSLSSSSSSSVTAQISTPSSFTGLSSTNYSTFSSTTSTSYQYTKGGIVNRVTESQQDLLVVAVIGWLVAAVAIIMFSVVLIKWKSSCRQKRDDQIPESELHPTYSGLMTGGTTVYEQIDMNHPGTQ